MESTSGDLGTAQDEIPLFRPAKKRKLHQRQRRDASSSPAPDSGVSTREAHDLAHSNDLHGSDPSNVDLTSVAAGTIRPRKAGSRKKLGIEFSGDRLSAVRSDISTTSSAIESHAKDEPESETVGLSSRFAPSSGLAHRQADEDKYMSAYIDSQLKSSTISNTVDASSSTEVAAQPESTPVQPVTAKQPALLGKLQEIDLGPSARRRNEKATLKASRLLSGEGPSAELRSGGNDAVLEEQHDDDDDSDEAARKKKKLPPKVRVNRYGRILPPRKPKRAHERSKENVERDRLVEDMLRGTISEVGPEAGVASPSSGCLGRADSKDAVEGDEELVERFRREFMESSSANARNAAVKATARKDDSKNVGPKMGGSRSMRGQAQQGAMKGRG